MDRRFFLKTTGAVAGTAALPAAAIAAAPAALAAPALLKGREELLVATDFPLDQPGTSTVLGKLGESLAAMTDGRLTLTRPQAAAQAGEADIFLGFPEGAGELAIGHDIVAGYPGGFDEPTTFGWLTFGGGYRLWSELAYEGNRKVFYAGHTGTPLIWARQESYRDLTGLAVEVGGFAGRVARALGAETAFAHPVEMVEGLSPLADTMHHTLTAFASCGESPFHSAGRTLSLSMPLARWQAFAASDQALIEGAIAAAATLAGAELGTHRLMARLVIARRNKPMSILFDRALVRRIEATAADLMADAARSHENIGKLVASIEGFRRLTTPAAGLTS